MRIRAYHVESKEGPARAGSSVEFTLNTTTSRLTEAKVNIISPTERPVRQHLNLLLSFLCFQDHVLLLLSSWNELLLKILSL